jgi:HEAT repeat protein
MTKNSRRLLRRREVRGGKPEGLGNRRAPVKQKDDQRAPETDQVEALVRTLDSEDPSERERARIALVKMGKAVVPRLMQTLFDQRGRMRWESAMALEAIRDVSAASALIQAVEDDLLEVRWAAAEGLIGLERDGLVALLQGLLAHAGSVRLREAAHRILTKMSRGEDEHTVKPVLEALDSPAPIAALPNAAFTALHNLKSHYRSSD